METEEFVRPTSAQAIGAGTTDFLATLAGAYGARCQWLAEELTDAEDPFSEDQTSPNATLATARGRVISDKMSANIRRDTATSAIWNVT